MMKRVLILFSVVFIAFAGCKKFGTGYVRGTVTEIGTGLPFPNVVVYLEREGKTSHPFAGSHSGDLVILDSVITDHAGHYDISFDKKAGYIYRIHCNPKNFVTDRSAYASPTYTELANKRTTKDFSIYPLGYMKIRLQKTSSSNNSVVLAFGQSGPTFQLPNFNYPFDTILPVYTIPANYILKDFEWVQIIQNPPSSIDHLDQLHVNKGDTLSYLINYN